MSREKAPGAEDIGVRIGDGDRSLSRGEAILKGALVAGAAYGTVSVGPFVRKALAASDDGDIAILNFALTVKHLEASFYEEAFNRVGGGSELTGLIGLLADEEQHHVRVLTAMIKKLGGEPAVEPKFDFSLGDPAAFLKQAQIFEDTGVGAFNGAATSIESIEVLNLVAAIAQMEARHAAAVRVQNTEEPAPEALDSSLDEAQVLEVVEPFIA